MSTGESQSTTHLQRLQSKVATAIAHWKEFWFAPEDPFTLGIIRLLTGSMLAYNLLVWGLDLKAFFSSDGLQPLAAIRAFYGSDPVFSFWFYVPDAWLTVVHWACFCIAVLMCAGVWTRVTTILCYLITISYSHRVPVANFGLDQILGLLCLYLAIGPSGAALSVDSLWRRRRSVGSGTPSFIIPMASCRMTLRLIQIHLCVIYFWAGFAKLKGESWWTGEAMWQVLANEEYQTTDLTWLAWIPWVPYLIAHATVAWEVFFCVLIWNKTLRPLMLAIGTGMHFGIGAFLGMWTFGLVMTYAYFAFSSPLAWRKRFHWVGPKLFDQPCQLVSSSEGEEQLPLHEIPANSVTSAPAMAGVATIGSTLVASECVDTPTVDTSLLLIAAHPEERAILRGYFRRHDILCKAASNPETAFSIIAKSQPVAIVVSGSRFRPMEFATLVDDLIDAAQIPILAVVSSQQQAALKKRDETGIRFLAHPSSPREIRMKLSQLLFSSSDLETPIPLNAFRNTPPVLDEPPISNQTT